MDVFLYLFYEKNGLLLMKIIWFCHSLNCVRSTISLLLLHVTNFSIHTLKSSIRNPKNNDFIIIIYQHVGVTNFTVVDTFQRILQVNKCI